MSPVATDADSARDVLRVVYQDVLGLLGDLAASDLSRTTRCVGWCVRDLIFHMLLDAQRALIAFTTASDAVPDTDAASYWVSATPDDAASQAHARFVRVSAAALSEPGLVALHRDTCTAVLRAVDRLDLASTVDTTQGHAIALPDFLLTLTVEAAIHHLDLIIDLPGAPAPDPVALAAVRATFDALLGGRSPADWDDVTYALKGAGRVPLDDRDRRALGPLADRLPLL